LLEVSILPFDIEVSSIIMMEDPIKEKMAKTKTMQWMSLALKFVNYDSLWNQKFATYNLELQGFIGNIGCPILWEYFPTFIELFDIFWLMLILHIIVIETN